MVSCPPRLRSDLTIRRQQHGGETYFVVKDPVSRHFFRFREVERFIAAQLDGATPLDVVRRRTEAEFAAALSAAALDAFVKRLADSGLLEGGHPPRGMRTGHRGRIRGGLLYLRVPLFDPDRLFTRLANRVRCCFTPSFLVLASTLILLAVGITLANGREIAQDVSRLYQLAVVPLLFLFFLLITSAHEFAHGLTCKHFGGEVREIGFMLFYFQPAFYTNVSDAWLFPEKAKRLWVSFAGPYFELFLWALATVTWWVTELDTAVHYLALIVMAISGVKSLLNFNPFLKLDGYYLLSDYLDIANVRKKSFRYLGGLIKRLVGFGSRIASDIAPRDRRIYLVYGLVATVCSVFLLGYVLVKVGGFFIEIRQPAALALLTGVVGLRLRHRFRNLFGGAPDPDGLGDNGDHVETSHPAGSSGRVKAKHHKGRSAGGAKRRIVWAALAAATLAALFLGRMELRIAGPFGVLPEENVDVRAEVDGVIEQVPVDEGDAVRAGQVIARLADRALVVDLRKLEADIRETRADLRKLEAGPTAEEIAVASAAVSRVEDQLGYAQTRVTRLTSLFDANVVTREELEAAQALAATAANELAEARGRLSVLRRGARPEEIEATRAQLDRLEAEQRYLEEQLRLLNIVSPVPGIVATPSRQLRTMERKLVKKGELIAKVYDFSRVMAQIAVSEKEIADVRVGQEVVLRVRAYPDVAFRGTVTAIATAAVGSSTSGAETSADGTSGGPGQMFIVTTRINNRSLLLKPGMTGRAKVLGGQRRIVSLITRRLARTFKVEFWSWW